MATNANDYFINSKDIKIYPSGYRGENNGKAYDPESKLNTEENATRPYVEIINYADNDGEKNKGDLVNGWEDSLLNTWKNEQDDSYPFSFIINGYYFKLLRPYTTLSPILLKEIVEGQSNAPDAVYAHIQMRDYGIVEKDDTENVCLRGRAVTNLYVKPTSGNITSTPNDGSSGAKNYTNLDGVLDSSSNDVESKFFGLGLVTSVPNDRPEDHLYLKLLEKMDSTWTDSEGHKYYDYRVPEKSRLILTSYNIWGGEYYENNQAVDKLLYNYLETGRIESHVGEDLTIQARTDTNTGTDLNLIGSKDINLTTLKGNINLNPKNDINIKINADNKIQVTEVREENSNKNSLASIKITDNSKFTEITKESITVNKANNSKTVIDGGSITTGADGGSGSLTTQNITATSLSNTDNENHAVYSDKDGKLKSSSFSFTPKQKETFTSNVISNVTQDEKGQISATKEKIAINDGILKAGVDSLNNKLTYQPYTEKQSSGLYFYKDNKDTADTNPTNTAVLKLDGKLYATSLSALSGNKMSPVVVENQVSPSTPTASWDSEVDLGTVGGKTFKFTMPPNPNTDTHYENTFKVKIKVNDTSTDISTFNQKDGNSITFIPGTNINLQGNSSDQTITINNSYSYELPEAKTGTLGGIKVGYTTSGNNCAVQLDSDNNAFVTVPAAATYNSGKNITINSADSNKINLNDTLTELTSITASGQIKAGTFLATSDRRLKENIKPLDYNKSILDLPVYTYDYINGRKNNIGCMAQDLQELYPQLVSEDENGYLSVDNSKVVYLLLEEVKLLKKEIEQLKNNK